MSRDLHWFLNGALVDALPVVIPGDESSEAGMKAVDGMLLRASRTLEALTQNTAELRRLKAQVGEIRGALPDKLRRLRALEDAEAEFAKSDAKSLQQEPGPCVSVLSWNIQSPDFSPNVLEFVPGRDSTSAEGYNTFQLLLEKAREWMLVPSTAWRLCDVLGPEFPASRTGDLERAPITDKETLEGLEMWLQSRQERCRQVWPDIDIGNIVLKWAAEPETRWEYWRGQTLNDWLRDDCSGGKVNTMLPPNSPTIDDLCWNLGLSSADRNYSRHPDRGRRARWLQLNMETCVSRQPPVGKFDYFKLLVWDMVLERIIGEAVEQSAFDSLSRELHLEDSSDRMNTVRERVTKADVAVLLEVPGAGLPGLDQFWTVSAPADPRRGPKGGDNTVILARKALFAQPVPLEFKDRHGESDPRVVGCDLHRLRKPSQGGSGPRPLRVVGVHLPGNDVDSKGIVPAIEEKLSENVILAGDFNIDLRSKLPPWVSETSTPRLLNLVRQSRATPLTLGTSNKERSPFQAQVSKMLLHDFCMKDFAFLGSSFRGAAIDGPVPASCRLPNADIPSDHAPLSFKIFLQDLDGVPP